MGKSKCFSIRISEELLERLEKELKGGNRNGWIEDAIRAKIDSKGVSVELTDKDKSKIVKGAQGLDQMIDDALKDAIKNRKDFLEHLTPAELARLAASRLPKTDSGDKEVKTDILSLENCLAALPLTEDITKELSTVKGKLFQTEQEKEILESLVKVWKKKAAEESVITELEEYTGRVYRGAVECALDIIIRRSLPGFGDGGGITAQGYNEIARLVKIELEGFGVR